jgi:peptidoglycan/LPS O-acetylase OafA/YrhL
VPDVSDANVPPFVRETLPPALDKAAVARRSAALDGLRGFAIIAVVLYHGRVEWVGGATTIISTFFPLSGFLITRNLMREIETTSQLDFPKFWVRRMRRLMPAAVIGVAFATAVGYWRGIAPRPIEVIAALTGWKNWHFLADGRLADVLVVWWSLSIEEQYYLVYPFVLLALMRFGGRRAAAIGLGAVAAMSLVVVFVWRAHGTERAIEVYYGTHGRLWEILAGCLLALYAQRLPRWFRVPTLVSFGIIVLCQTNLLLEHDLWWAPPIRIMVTVLATVWLIDGVVFSAESRTTRVLGAWPLRPLGLISYEMYMVHATVLVMLPHLGGIRLFTVTGAFMLTVLLSYGVHLLAQRFTAS